MNPVDSMPSGFSRGVMGVAAGAALDPDPTVANSAEEAEGMFLSLLVKELRRGIPGDGLFGKGPGKDVYEGLFDSLVGQDLARNGGIGLQESLLSALSGRVAADDPKLAVAGTAAAETAPHQVQTQRADHGSALEDKRETPRSRS